LNDFEVLEMKLQLQFQPHQLEENILESDMHIQLFAVIAQW